MPESPEARARKNIDQLLTAAGWIVQSRDEVNLAAGRGVAIREFPMKPGFGEADSEKHAFRARLPPIPSHRSHYGGGDANAQGPAEVS